MLKLTYKVKFTAKTKTGEKVVYQGKFKENLNGMLSHFSMHHSDVMIYGGDNLGFLDWSTVKITVRPVFKETKNV